MQVINTKGSSAEKDLQTINTVANAHALCRKSIERLIGAELGRSEKVNLDDYLMTALGNEIDKA